MHLDLFLELAEKDYLLIDAARETLKNNFHPVRHTVASAVLCSSGKVYTGINIESIKGPCAESVAIGTAFTNGEREILSIVSVRKREDEYPVLSPCGNCRQMLVIYAPESVVIFNNDGQILKTKAMNLLPGAYIFLKNK